jgi:hypothetical protein
MVMLTIKASPPPLCNFKFCDAKHAAVPINGQKQTGFCWSYLGENLNSGTFGHYQSCFKKLHFLLKIAQTLLEDSKYV